MDQSTKGQFKRVQCSFDNLMSAKESLDKIPASVMETAATSAHPEGRILASAVTAAKESLAKGELDCRRHAKQIALAFRDGWAVSNAVFEDDGDLSDAEEEKRRTSAIKLRYELRY